MDDSEMTWGAATADIVQHFMNFIHFEIFFYLIQKRLWNPGCVKKSEIMIIGECL
jgi:hypothetical protein